MKRHTRIYMRHFGYGEQDFIPCEVCASRAVDIHHIDARGMGGDPNKTKDVIENLQALCRTCHTQFGDRPQYMESLIRYHKIKLENGNKVNHS
jgi:5-methylcytosine-specific restriction endonuclease McrA